MEFEDEQRKFPKSLMSGDAEFVKMIPVKPMFFSKHSLFDRSVIRDMCQTGVVGVIKNAIRMRG